jgi:hypothetical protein
MTIDGIEAGYLSETLHHFWGGDRGFEIFTSIATRGLLLTVPTKNFVERFRFTTDTGDEEFFDAVSKARCCFTDIPPTKLANHVEYYGRWGIGFRREIMLKWGAVPVLYLPNHPRRDTLQEAPISMLRDIQRARVSLDTYLAVLEELDRPERMKLSVKFDTKTLKGEELREYVRCARDSILHFLSYVKVMSSREEDDQFFLREREWRIVSGVVISGEDPFLELDDSTKAALLGKRPDWGEPPDTGDPNVGKGDPSERLVDRFRFFNGMRSTGSVCQNASQIIVPGMNDLERVREFIKTRAELFGTKVPRVVLFDELSAAQRS